MIDTAKVNLFGTHMGTFRWDSARNIAIFEYNPGFIGSGIEPSPITMPVREGRLYSFGNLSWDSFNGLPGMLADSLPDTYGRALFERWLSLTGRTSGNPVESLCFLGKRCMGALEFEPAVELDINSDKVFEINSLVEVAAEALSRKEAFSTNLSAGKKDAVAQILQLGTSAGGQRAKAVIAYNPSTGEVRSGQITAPEGFQQYLIKLDGVNGPSGLMETTNYGRLEYSFYLLAKKCGINMAHSSLIEEHGRAHFLTKRFDRNGSKKIHMQTLCGIAHFDFRLRHAYSYEQALAIMRRLRLPYSDAQELFRRLVFNVVVRNQDDHTKNISFLMDENGKWSLAPAYDMGYSYNPAGPWTATHQMSVNGKFDNITREDLCILASSNGIVNSAETIDRIATTAASWPVIARNCGIPEDIINHILPNMLLSI